MMTTRILALAAVPALAVAAGCGSSGGTAASHPAAPAVTSAQAHGSAGYSAGPGDGPVSKRVRLGQPFEISYPYSSGGTAAWRITLQSVTCGGSGIFDPKTLAASGAAVPVPGRGLQFCLARFAVTNQGHSNDVWSVRDTATVNVGVDAYSDETTSGPGKDAQDAYNTAPTDSQYGLDPHAAGVSYGVYQIPSGARATSVSVADDTALHTINGDSFQVLITLPPVPAARPSAPAATSAPAAVSHPAAQAPATHPASPATPAGYLGNIFGGGTGNPCNFASGYQSGVCNPTGESQSQYIANPGGPAPGTSTNSQGCYYVKMGEGYCPSTGKYIPMQDTSQPSPPAAPSSTGDPSNGSGTGAACTTVAGYYPAGLPGHEDSSGFCVAN